MEAKVVFFGMIAEKLEKDSDQIDLMIFDDRSESYVEVFKNLYPALRELTFQVAVDKKLNGEISVDTKEIALLPPFAGG